MFVGVGLRVCLFVCLLYDNKPTEFTVGMQTADNTTPHLTILSLFPLDRRKRCSGCITQRCGRVKRRAQVPGIEIQRSSARAARGRDWRATLAVRSVAGRRPALVVGCHAASTATAHCARVSYCHSTRLHGSLNVVSCATEVEDATT